MPFHQRTVEPARLHRPEAAGAGAAGAPLFRSLEQVSSHALVCLLEQLADLSRCAGDIFGELEGQAAALGRRTAALHRRLDALHAAAARLDHRRVKIREWRAGGRVGGGERGGEAPRERLPPALWRPGAGSGAAARSPARVGPRVGTAGPGPGRLCRWQARAAPSVVRVGRLDGVGAGVGVGLAALSLCPCLSPGGGLRGEPGAGSWAQGQRQVAGSRSQVYSLYTDFSWGDFRGMFVEISGESRGALELLSPRCPPGTGVLTHLQKCADF